MKSPLVLLAFAVPAVAQSPSTWVLDQSTLTYHMSHPVHEVDGVSHAAKGKGICAAGTCEFLVAAPVKSFDSGDTNRDLHMIQTVRGAEFPVVTVRFKLPEADLNQPEINPDLEVTFAGNTAHYAHVPFHQTISGNTHRIEGTVPSTVKDFKIDPPSFLMMPIKNDIPVKVDTTWHK